MAPDDDSRPAKRLCVVEEEVGNYDVFISHRGPDIKTGFVSFLDKDLRRAGLRPFLDRLSIGEGQHSWKVIERAIRRTPLALVLFSENFAESEWCLRELHAMLACPSMTMLPIFYNVQPWEVKYPEQGQLAVGFKKLMKLMTERHEDTLIEKWRVDLDKASEIGGWVRSMGDQRFETELVEEVVGKIFELANKPLPLYVGDHIVGVKQVAEKLIQIVDEQKVLILGLWGMGGIGKSTLAWELYNQLGRRFDARCYVEDVAEKVIQGDVTTVQNHLLKGLCEIADIVNKSQGKVILEERLSKKRILVILDDVRDGDQMKYLMSRKMLLKEGSLCIVTSRNCRVFEESTSLNSNPGVYTHDVQLLSQEHSQSVFARHVFGDDGEVPKEFEVLVGNVSMACGGLLLVLEVCGSLLRGEKDDIGWMEVLSKLNCGSIMTEDMILECLRIRYDTLSKQHQEMFLDIACACLGKSVEMANCVWRSQGWYGVLGVRTLVERALIRVDNDFDNCRIFGMHDHLRDMGHAIVREERLRSGIYKRLWGSELSLLDKNEVCFLHG